MKQGYIFIVIIVTMLLIGLQVNKARGWGMEAKVIPEEFDIEMNILSGADISRLYPKAVTYKDVKFLQEEVYVFGRVLSSSDRSAIISIDIQCKEMPYLKEENIKIGWIGPNKTSPIFFLRYLGTYLDKEDIHGFKVIYKIKKVFKK